MKQNKRPVISENEAWFSSLAANDEHLYDADKAYKLFCANKQAAARRQFMGKKVLSRLAAVVLLVLASTVSFWIGEKQFASKCTDIIVESPLGSKSKLSLPDGSTVWLNAGSKISYSQGFGIENRFIALEGEAYFDVKQDKKLPFEVKTKQLNVSVLGTKFNFRNYDSEDEVSVNLIEGKVELQNQMKEMKNQFLNPTEMVTLNKSNGEMIISKMETMHSQDWIHDKLFFDEMRLADIAKVLERSYNVKILFNSKACEDIKFHALFNKREQSIADVFDILKKTGKFEYKLNGDTITIINNIIR